MAAILNALSFVKSGTENLRSMSRKIWNITEKDSEIWSLANNSYERFSKISRSVPFVSVIGCEGPFRGRCYKKNLTRIPCYPAANSNPLRSSKDKIVKEILVFTIHAPRGFPCYKLDCHDFWSVAYISWMWSISRKAREQNVIEAGGVMFV